MKASILIHEVNRKAEIVIWVPCHDRSCCSTFVHSAHCTAYHLAHCTAHHLPIVLPVILPIVLPIICPLMTVVLEPALLCPVWSEEARLPLPQVRECATALLHVAKPHDIPIFLVGHVTKSGDIAGPKVLEHIVDVVLYMEGEKHQSFR